MKGLVTGLILAAGHSTRMGMLKQLLPFGKSTVLEQVVKALTTSKLHAVTVVLGHRSEEIRSRLTSWPVHTVINPDPDGDMLSSIQCGIRSIPEDQAVMIALGDQPLISEAMVDLLITAYERKPSGMVLPVHNSRRGHPMIIAPAFREELLTLSEGGLKTIRDRHEDQVITVPVDTDAVLIDLDYRHEYERALHRIARESDSHGN